MSTKREREKKKELSQGERFQIISFIEKNFPLEKLSKLTKKISSFYP